MGGKGAMEGAGRAEPRSGRRQQDVAGWKAIPSLLRTEKMVNISLTDTHPRSIIIISL
ncbi:MAG: hypothetical protein FWG27_04465 [Treponema sp.]|nr:hypothetical protein [Treponema sp.]